MYSLIQEAQRQVPTEYGAECKATTEQTVFTQECTTTESTMWSQVGWLAGFIYISSSLYPHMFESSQPSVIEICEMDTVLPTHYVVVGTKTMPCKVNEDLLS